MGPNPQIISNIQIHPNQNLLNILVDSLCNIDLKEC